MTKKPTRRTQKRSSRELEHTAYHEAGHAVMGRVLGIVCSDVNIVPDYGKRRRGVAIADSDPNDVWTNWQTQGKFREFDPAVRASIMLSMAGKEAELIQFGSHHGGDYDDELQIALKREESEIIDHQINYLRRKTRTMLLRHRQKVDHVAKALLSVRTLTSEQIDALMAEKITPRQRKIAKRIEAARKPDRDLYLARRPSVERR